MKQIVQDLGNGRTEVIDVPAPSARPGYLLIRTTRSVVSPGTERMLRDFGKANLVQKALQQPDRVLDVLNKVRTDGLAPTIAAVRAKLDQPTPLGYCNVGRVLESGGIEGFKAGDRVASNGQHAELVRVPKNLCCRIPDVVDDDTAAFTVLGAIALQGIRLADPKLGETVAVIGLGLVGLLAVQLLRAQGVRVVGIDLDAGRCALAAASGAETVCIARGEDPVAQALAFSRGRGVDAVLICAATKSNAPIAQSAQMCRQRGRVVLIGVVGLDVPRDEFYRKEITFQVSCSYGPGRYDPDYEDGGHDYPVGFVRWTAQRNFEAVLDMMAGGHIDVRPFISRRAPFADAGEAYKSLDDGGQVLGILFEYGDGGGEAGAKMLQTSVAVSSATAARPGKRLGVIGAGNYATRTLIPAFIAAGAQPVAVCGSGTAVEVHAAKKFGFARALSRSAELIQSADIDLVVVATRHDSHARLVVEALDAGRAVFVEKPLALTAEEMKGVDAAYRRARAPFLMVGFNRRFSPYATRLRDGVRGAKAAPAIVMTINAGAIPASHWTQDPVVGGGRIVGEACHFVDLARFIAGAAITGTHALALDPDGASPRDSATLSLTFANGAIATIHYLANGHRGMAKERIEVFCGGRVWCIDNFRRLEGFGTPGLSGGWLAGQDKGQTAMARAVLDAASSGMPAPIPFEELREVSLATIELDRRLRGA